MDILAIRRECLTARSVEWVEEQEVAHILCNGVVVETIRRSDDWAKNYDFVVVKSLVESIQRKRWMIV
jgi:hypothetical protein